MSFWIKEPKFNLPVGELKRGKDLYDIQIGHLASALLIDDFDPQIQVDICPVFATTNFKFPKDALISGSFMMNCVAKSIGYIQIEYDDIDIYFKTKEDAQEFITLNKFNGAHAYTGYTSFDFSGPMCAYGHINGNKFNLIYGVEYTSPGNLISKFDIRACSMALDMNTLMLHTVAGSVSDAGTRQIHFNSMPRSVTVRRLAKYIKKGFEIDGYQSLFFVELLKSHIYSPELELLTKNY